MSFKIKVEEAIFEWKDNKLHCSSDKKLNELKELLKFHIPKVVVMPDGIDYDEDLTAGSNAYFAILGTFKNSEVIKEPTDKFLHPYFDETVIY